MSAGDAASWTWRAMQLLLAVSSVLWGVRLVVNWQGAARALSRDAQLLEPLRERWGLDETWWRLAGVALIGGGITV